MRCEGGRGFFFRNEESFLGKVFDYVFFLLFVVGVMFGVVICDYEVISRRV